jgi:hypothetical protein
VNVACVLNLGMEVNVQFQAAASLSSAILRPLRIMQNVTHYEINTEVKCKLTYKHPILTFQCLETES